ncbi:SixA phosphatase family protein [Neolewinella litorea]|uniref:Histidine phosphatase family protein n=1 Tax=Neolewinella litorea TaxID=2562452 RepID=A0A4S4N8V0_9BACT|nr:histidine phosphatase family protein [Neolewinella litorea]THH35569.1 histidine phosphatase family protein [Neolewinella litorea]
MKQVYLVRHAKSSWADPNLKDHDRPLNSRGRRDAPAMAARLAKSGLKVDGILTSSAKRTRQTAKAFAEAFGLGKDQILKEKKLYHAGPRTIEKCVRNLPESWNTVLIFGHNPGYTEAANHLRHDDYIGNVPTCGIVGSELDVKSWSDWEMARAKRTAYYYPKQKI